MKIAHCLLTVSFQRRCAALQSTGSSCLLLLVAGLLLILVAHGCGRATEPPEYVSQLAEVTGTVTLDGKPLAGAMLMFVPADTNTGVATASGSTDETGSYRLVTAIPNVPIEESQGAVPGAYRVVITRLAMPDGSPLPPGTSPADAMAEGAKEFVPARYSDFVKTTLKVEIGEEAKQHDFELQSK